MAQNPWLVPITNLKRAPGTRRTERRSGRVGELRVAASVVPPNAEVTADAMLDAVDGGIEVTADLSAPWQGECRRCLRPVEGLLQVHVRELYRRRDDTHGHGHGTHGHGHGTHGHDTHGHDTHGHATHGHGTHGHDTHGHDTHGHHPPAADEEDEETYPLRGELLDLQPLIRDALLLELPLAPLCSEDCQGLCPTCGADLNDGPCDCDHAPSDPRWAALDLLKDPGPTPEQTDPGLRRPG